MIIQEKLTIQQKLEILSDAAKYDVSCSSSGVGRSNNGQGIGNSVACGVCHSFSADGRCISLLKILFTNECIYDCRYCINRVSNDMVRTAFTPEEVCTLTMEFYRRNYIEGLFLSSGIIGSPDNTMQLLCETVMLLRVKHHFGGYIHLKGIPGASEDLINMAGWYADRMSVNLELPTADGLKRLAPHKNRKNILTPMRQIQRGITDNRSYLEMKDIVTEPAFVNEQSLYKEDGTNENILSEAGGLLSNVEEIVPGIYDNGGNTGYSSDITVRKSARKFVPAGQSTQMIIGATEETDYHIVTVAEALYNKFDLKRVFYSAFINVNKDDMLPSQPDGRGVPLLREHRLYQADWLLRYYGFKASELLSEDKPNFNVFLDPKCDWAIRHLEQFPVEINRADYYTLLRVPGIGVTSAKRIVKARRASALGFEDIRKMGVVLKRALYFITCSGRMMYSTKIDENYITNSLVGVERVKNFEIEYNVSYKQLSLFDDMKFSYPANS